MNLRWTLRRTSPAGIIMLLVGGLMLVSASQAPETQDAAYDMPSLLFTPATAPAGPTTTVTLPTTTTTVAPAPIVYDPIPPGGRQRR